MGFLWSTNLRIITLNTQLMSQSTQEMEAGEGLRNEPAM